MDKKTKEYLSNRAQPLKEKTVMYKARKDKNFGLPSEGSVTLITGKCPCSVCGHKWMWECDETVGTDYECYCCSSTCT